MWSFFSDANIFFAKLLVGSKGGKIVWIHIHIKYKNAQKSSYTGKSFSEALNLASTNPQYTVLSHASIANFPNLDLMCFFEKFRLF